MPDDANPVGALQVTVDWVVNCADAYALLPPEQFARTLQSYSDADASPERFTDKEVVPVAALVQVLVEFNL
jgi:hypothetical protein